MPDGMTVRYFAYGSNLHPLRLIERVPSARLLGTTHVAGWTLSFSKRGQDGSGKCTIAVGSGVVHGAVYEMSTGDKATLDAIEGVGKGYLRQRLEVPDFGECSTYIADRAFVDESLLPFTWYRDLVHAGALRHDFDEPYLDRIRLLAATVDRDASRRRRNERLVARLRRSLAD